MPAWRSVPESDTYAQADAASPAANCVESGKLGSDLRPHVGQDRPQGNAFIQRQRPGDGRQ